jgi:hypothetical protein
MNYVMCHKIFTSIVYTNDIYFSMVQFLTGRVAHMSGSKPKKKQLKDSQLIIRLAAADRDRFVSLCDTLDTSAAREIRRFIRDFLNKHDAPTEPQTDET